MTEEEANALVHEHTTFKKEPGQNAVESSILMQLETVSVAQSCSDAVYTMLGELWLRKKRTLAIKHLKLTFGSHVSNHAEFQTFMTSLSQNARLQSLELRVPFEHVENCPACTQIRPMQGAGDDDEFDFWQQLLFSPDLNRSLQRVKIDLEISKFANDTPILSMLCLVHVNRRLTHFDLTLHRYFRRLKGDTLSGSIFKDTQFLN